MRKTEYNWDEIVRLYCEEQIGIRMIGKKLGCRPQTVSHALKCRGITRRNLHEGMKLAWAKGSKVSTNLKGDKSLLWKGGKTRLGGYVLIYCPEHPRACRNYIPEHILIWEQANKRQVPDGWVIHHLNGIKDDNRPENLVAMAQSGHSRQELGEIYKKRIRELEAEIKRLKTQQLLPFKQAEIEGRIKIV